MRLSSDSLIYLELPDAEFHKYLSRLEPLRGMLAWNMPNVHGKSNAQLVSAAPRIRGANVAA